MENVKEIWKDIPNYEGLYQVSNLGNVKSLKFGSQRILKYGINSGGYCVVVLCKNKTKTLYVHKLVAEVFLNEKCFGREFVVNHKNFIRNDNRLDNLEIVTNRENTNKKHIKSSSKYVGVCWDKVSKKWKSQIWVNGKRQILGHFVNEYDANLAYQNKLKTISIKK